MLSTVRLLLVQENQLLGSVPLQATAVQKTRRNACQRLRCDGACACANGLVSSFSTAEGFQDLIVAAFRSGEVAQARSRAFLPSSHEMDAERCGEVSFERPITLPHMTSAQFKDFMLGLYGSPAGIHLLRDPSARVNLQKLAHLKQCDALTAVDTRPVYRSREGSAPSTYWGRIADIWKNMEQKETMTPAEAEQLISSRSDRLFPCYASDIALRGIEHAGRNDATLLDVPMVDLVWKDDELVMRVRGALCHLLTIRTLTHAQQHHRHCHAQDPATRFDHYAFAPTSIAASDDGMGSKGLMNPGIGSAVAIMSELGSTTRLHTEDSYLGSSNLLISGADKVRSRPEARMHPRPCSALIAQGSCVQVWYAPARDYVQEFERSLPKSQRHGAPAKNYLPCWPSEDDVRSGRMIHIVQRPGDLVITEPVRCLSHKNGCLLCAHRHVQWPACSRHRAPCSPNHPTCQPDEGA